MKTITPAQLRGLASLHEYTDRDIEVLLAAASACHFEAGASLCEEGRPGSSCFFVVSGEVEIVRTTPDGPRVIANQGVGTIVGHMALVERTPRTATVRAVTAVSALEFSRLDFDTLLEACSPFAIRFQEQIAVTGIRQLRRATANLLELLSHDGEANAATAPATRDALRYISTATSEWALPVVKKPRERSP